MEIFLNEIHEKIIINIINAFRRVNPLPKKRSELTLEVLLKTMIDIFTKLSELLTKPFDLLTLLVGHKLSNQLGVRGVPEPNPAIPSPRNQVGPAPC